MKHRQFDLSRTVIIAEAGVNHNGSLKTAFEMVDAAVAAHADYIKFQTFKADSLVTANCRAANYQSDNCGAKSQFEILKRLELTEQDFRRLHEYCEIKRIGFLSTPFDSESIDFLQTLNPDFMKVPSGEITNLPYLRRIASTGLPVIMSTGMCTLDDIRSALKPFLAKGYSGNNLILLHCTTQYPTPPEDVNLKAMATLKREFGFPVGYSDHTLGIAVPIAAVALGAAVIEKHFTLSKAMDGPDHAASLEPDEFALMTENIRIIEKALGNGEKIAAESEKSNIPAARKSIVASRFIPAGKVIEEEDITAKRPGSGLSPMLWDTVIGTKAIRDFNTDEMIEI